MKGNMWKRAASIGFVFALSLGLCACGKKNENASLAKEGVYSVQSFELPGLDYDYYDVVSSSYRNDKIYVLINAEDWSSDEYWSGTILLSMNKDGSDMQTSNLEMPVYVPGTGEALPPGTELPESSVQAPMVPADPPMAIPEEEETEGEGGDTEGEEEGSEGSTEGEAAADTTAPEENVDGIDSDDYLYPSDEYNSYTWENSYYGNYTFGSDGKLYAIRSYNYEYDDYENPENNVYTEKAFLSCWNGDGSYLWDTEMEGFRSDNEWVYIEAMTVAEDGSVNLLLNGETVSIMTVDAQGKASDKKPLPEDAAKLLSTSFSAYARDDGTFLMMYYGENYDKQYLARFTPATGTMEELGEVPSSVAMNGYGMRPGVSSDFVYRTNLGIYTYNVGDEDSQMKMSFINSDLNISSVYAVIEMDENSFVGIYQENYDSEIQAGVFTRVNPEDIPEKSVLVLAGNGIGSNLKQRVVEFNRSSEKYRIVVKDYSQYMTYDDYYAGVTQLNNDVISGKMPDILIASDLPTETYAAKGWLEDIGRLIEKDEELSQVEFVQNVFDAYSMEGTLYYVVPRFNVVTMMAKKSLVGERESWTMDDAMKLVESLPEGTTLFENDTTRSQFLNEMMRFCGSDFMDVSTGKCDFNSQNFIKMMEYAKTLPEEFEYDEDYWMNYDYYAQFRENKVILMDLYLSSFSNDIYYCINGIMGEDVSYVGFPTESGKGSYLNASERYAISSRSDYVDGAWEFLRYYLTDEYQKEMSWGFPIQKKYFEELSKEATRKPHYTDENGEEVEYPYTMWMGGEEIEIDPLSQEQLDELLAFLYTVDTAYYSDNEILNIVTEEMGPYFAGQKSVEEAVAIVQSRAQLYVDENR